MPETASPSAASLVAASTPPVTVRPPRNVLSALSVSVPGPVFSTAPGPEMEREKVALPAGSAKRTSPPLSSVEEGKFAALVSSVPPGRMNICPVMLLGAFSTSVPPFWIELLVTPVSALLKLQRPPFTLSVSKPLTAVPTTPVPGP